ncbi:MAG: uracil-DNA glycosylase [Lachnospiraceae bacterium]|nr:uracil-DNA glycosylase [Lachnospiraceae bacterium]
MAALTGSWAEALAPEFKKPYYAELYRKVRDAYRASVVYPPAQEIFKAFHLTPLARVKVVIIGQDPYHDPGQAEGLSFSVRKGTEIPPSLVNIYTELHEDIGCPVPSHGSLVHWAEQGVLLLNALLTVRAHAAFSHKDFGWQEFTDAAIRALDAVDRPMVFILWGRPAQEKEKYIRNPERLVIRSPHPSPLSAYRGFFGSRPFSRANEYLASHGETPVDWAIPD